MKKENEQFVENGNGRPENGQNFFDYKKEIILFPDQALSEDQKVRLSHELTPITAHGFMRDISTKESYDALFQDVFNHVVPCDRLNIYRAKIGNEPIAFIATGLKVFEDLLLYHVEGIITDPKVQGKGFANDILSRELIECGADVLTFHTQSILMKKLGERVSEFDLDLTRKIAEFIGTSNLVDLPEGPIDQGRYGGNSLYGDIKKFDLVAIKQPRFDYLNGDAIVFAGRIKR
ncbi:MAG TPA: hypothetical protein VKC54_04250 [Patescibacteria group bacterium]|nr:hypothetical protein [Patescibacteria group bacterium]